MNALNITAADLAGALTRISGTVAGKEPVQDPETGEAIGWVREQKPGGWWEWLAACPRTGSVRTREQAMERVHEAIADDRRDRQHFDRELAALPGPLRALSQHREECKFRLEIERQRSTRRPADYRRAENELRQAELAYAAAERALAEAA